jgi:hypothetical protein
MKSQLQKMAFGLVSAMALAGTCLWAQLSHRMVAEIPFDFQVSGQTLPAGSYSVKDAGTEGMTQVTSEATRHSIFVFTPGTKDGRERESKLVFHRYGDNYFLSQIWIGSTTGRVVAPNRRERELQTQAALHTAVVPLAAE